MARRDETTTRSDLHGREVVVNDHSGDAFQGTCWAFDDHGVTLIATGKEPVVLHSPAAEPLKIAGHCHIPTASIKFVQVP